MEQHELYACEHRCTQEEMPHCRAACPLQVDVRVVLEHLAKGDTPAARKSLERHLPLPGFLGLVCDHPCEAVCLRAPSAEHDLGGAVAIGELERFCVSSAPRQTRPLPMPRKAKSVAVLGDGMAALVAAWDLGRKGYPVTVFHAGEAVGLKLMERLAASGGKTGLTVEILAQALAEELVFMDKGGKGPVEFERKSAESMDAALLADLWTRFDAVFVDAGEFPFLSPLRSDLSPVTLSGASAVPGLDGLSGSEEEGRLCFGGWLEGGSVVGQAADGRRAAATLERFLSGVSVTASREKEGVSESRLWTPLDGVEAVPRVEPQSLSGNESFSSSFYTPDEAQAEAARCLRCECMACVRQCAYLQHYKAYPKSYARQIYNNAAIVKGQHLANNLINGCSLCGQCEVICPDNFSMADLCLSARREMVERGYMPPSAHEFALEDMETANGPDCALTVGDPERCGHLFFPGCQLAASRGDQVMTVLGHLRSHLEGGVGLSLGCCGVPARWAGREDLFSGVAEGFRAQWEALGKPRVVAACASCLKTLRESQPDMELVSLWEVLERECPEPDASFNLTLTLHDPCAARHDKMWLESTRRLLGRHGVTVEEPPFSGEATACCGYGGLTWSAQPDVAAAMVEHRAGQLPHDAVASCIMCRDRLVTAGKPCLHMLDILFPLHDAACSALDPANPGPGLSARRSNRAALKRRVLRELRGENVPEPAPEAPFVEYAPGVESRLDGHHILRGDVLRVIRESLAARSAFLDKNTGHWLASWRPSRVTYWVEYAPVGDGYMVYDAYSHRMVVPGTGNAEQAVEDANNTNTTGRGFQSSFRPADERSGVTSARRNAAQSAEIKSSQSQTVQAGAPGVPRSGTAGISDREAKS